MAVKSPVSVWSWAIVACHLTDTSHSLAHSLQMFTVSTVKLSPQKLIHIYPVTTQDFARHGIPWKCPTQIHRALNLILTENITENREIWFNDYFDYGCLTMAAAGP